MSQRISATKDPGDDADVVDRYLAGARSAYERIDAWIHTVVRHRAWRLTGDGGDLRQEVHLRLLDQLPRARFRGESSLKTFVQAVAKHVCIDAIRRQRLRRTEPLVEQIADRNDQPDERLDRHESWRLCHRVLAALSETCRELFQLILVEEKSYEELAVSLDVPIGTIKSRLARCRDRAVTLRHQIEKMDR